MTDYSVYDMNRKELRDYYTVSGLVLGLLGYLFYHSLIAAVLLALLAIPLKKLYVSYLIRKRKDHLAEGFRDFLYSISASLAAGRQMPQAIAAAAAEMSASYGENSDIATELAHISALYGSAHADPAELLRGFAARSGLDDIASFAAAYSVCRRSGGDIESVCIKSAELLLDKIEYRESAQALIAEKKLDLAILSAMPPGILFFLNMSSYEYIELLYTSTGGRALMSLALLLMASALAWGLKMMEITI